MASDLSDLAAGIATLLEPGIAHDGVDHAKQIALITSLIFEGFDREGMNCVLIGGGAIELYAPGIFKSGDIDLIIDAGLPLEGSRGRIDRVFKRLGFEPYGRHWRRDELFVEVPAFSVDDPTDLVRVGSFILRVIAKETLLADRVIGFKHWKVTAYGQQAIDMIAAFGDELRMEILMPRLQSEAAVDAFEELKRMAESDAAVDEPALNRLIETLHDRGTSR